MKKIIINLLLCLSLSIVACGNNENTEIENESGKSLNKIVSDIGQYNFGVSKNWIEKVISEISFMVTENIEKQEQSVQTEQEKADLDNYKKILHKIWIPQEWEGNVNAIHDTGFSISIYEVENNMVKGRISTKSLIELPCFYYSFNEYEYPVFSGTINGNIVEGSFCDEYGNKGNIRVVLKDENEIEADFEYINENMDVGLFDLNGNYILRPYNLKDREEVIINVSNKVSLNSWGDVYLAGGKIDTGERTVGQAFLTDSEGNIFYKFRLPFCHGTEITNAYVKDINEDGLMDVVLYEFFGDYDKNNKEWNILQREDGLFYSEVLEK